MAESVLPRVKVCGVRAAADLAELADAPGAELPDAPGAELPDAAGIVLWSGSPRHVKPAAAEALARELPRGVLRVAVMVDTSPAEVPEWADLVQLCGGEAPEPWNGFRLPILRRIPAADGAEAVIELWRGVATGFVLDHPSGPGGSGRVIDLAVASKLARLAPCLLAGGLDETNVAERVRAVRPAGVDASSRLESAPGRKDPARVAAFVRAARAALAEVGS